jgi:hypothetical protein
LTLEKVSQPMKLSSSRKSENSRLSVYRTSQQVLCPGAQGVVAEKEREFCGVGGKQGRMHRAGGI